MQTAKQMTKGSRILRNGRAVPIPVKTLSGDHKKVKIVGELMKELRRCAEK